jgi:hypothetical protein
MLLFGAVRASAQGRPDCADVLRAFQNPKVIGHGAHHPSAVKIADLLGTDPYYVQKCAESYGRHVKRRESLTTRPPSDEEIDDEEKREEEEYDEVSQEEKETEGDKYVQTIPDDVQNRKKIEQNRNDDTPNEWDQPYEHRGWVPLDDKPWLPFERADDE